MTTFTSLGIDLSTSATGLVLLQASKNLSPDLLLEKELKTSKVPPGAEKNKFIALYIMELIHEHKPDRIVIEGYSLNMKNAKSVIPLVELGGVLRLMMHLDGLSWFDPRATELKKFVCGAGTVSKDQIMMFVLKRWKHESLSNNTADAYGLACMGLAHAGRLVAATLEQRKVVGAMVKRLS